jgi:V8-like Glu-specific endopeptidase
LVAALAFPAFAAAESTEEGGAVVEPVVTSQKEAQQFWTQARLESAEPLSVLTLPESPLITQVNPEPEQTVNAAEGAGIATLAATADGQTAGREGVEIGSSESTVFPNSANGKVYGAYVVEGSIEPYECSGSVVHSSQGDVVLTAGHCVVDRETGAEAKFLMFKPAYNHGSAPRGTWFAAEVTIPESWKKTAKAHSSANEGADLAFLTLYKSGEKKNVEEVVGGLGIGFDQTCNQTYTQYGYPAESPYDGESLFTHVAPYAGADTNLFFTPEPMKIASDFTPGASGGPWTIGASSSPTTLSLTAYGYANQPDVLYGPYFGETARKVYNEASGLEIAAGAEETCKALPETPVTPSPTQPAPPAETAPPTSAVSLKVTRVRHRANGSAVLTAQVSGAGSLMLRGAAVRAESVATPAAGKYRMVVAPKAAANRRLRQDGRAKVGVKVAFSASGKIRRVSRAIQLSRPAARQRAQQQAQRRG